jgi:hypothetical protein
MHRMVKKAVLLPAPTNLFTYHELSRIHLSDRFQILTEALINWDHKYSLHRDHSYLTEPEQYYAPLSSLSARGWTLQERLLSRRLIHYTSWELVWECCQDIHC